MEIYLISGHGNGDPGAIGNGYQEQDLTRKFNKLLLRHFKNNKVKVKLHNIKQDVYQLTAKGKGMYSFKNNNKIYIETHFNAASNKNANGCETLIAQGLVADDYDKTIQKTLSKYFENRGIKKRSDLLNMNVAKQRGLNYRLIEVCFISNKDDVIKLINDMDNIAKELVNNISKIGKIKLWNKKVRYKAKENKLNVRKEPNTSSKIYRILNKNSKPINYHGEITINGYKWYVYKNVLNENVYVASKYLVKV